MEMPPVPLWFRGREHYGQFMDRVFAMVGRECRMLRTTANGQPAAGAYFRGDRDCYEAHSVQVFTVTPAGISCNVVFYGHHLFEVFGLPPALDLAGRPARAAGR
jgi:RNA polymerase sigma-70 factor, ECF subfamily